MRQLGITMAASIWDPSFQDSGNVNSYQFCAREQVIYGRFHARHVKYSIQLPLPGLLEVSNDGLTKSGR